jgi:hypothetical protein
MQQADRYNELYLTEKEKKIDVERELMDCKVIMFSICVWFFSSLRVSSGHHSNCHHFVPLDEVGEK